MQTLLIDANQLVSDFHLVSAPWRILLDQVANGLIEVVVPESVVREAVGKYRRELSREIDDLRKGLKLLSQVDGEAAAARRRDFDVDALVTSYEETLRGALSEAGIHIPLPDSEMLLRLTDRAIARTPPFNEQGHGFRDGILWEHVLIAVTSGKSPVLLVSADKVFGSQTGELAQPLQDELRRSGLADGDVTLRRDLGSFVRDYITPDPVSHAAAAQLMDDEFAQISANISMALYGAPIEVAGALGEGTIRASYVVNALVAKSGADPADDEGVILFIVAEVRMGVEVEAYDPVGDHRFTGLYDIEGQEVALTATYHRRVGTIDNFSPSDVGVVAVSNGFVF